MSQNPKVELIAVLGSIEASEGPPKENEFKNPSALSCDAMGNLLVADTDNHRVVKLDRERRVTWAVGRTDASGVPEPGTAQAEFRSPQAICSDNANNVYVADTLNSRVQKLSPTGEFVTAWGGWGIGYGQFGGAGPLGIAIDEQGLVLVSDSHTAIGGNHRVQKFESDGRFMTQFGSYGAGLGQFGGSVPIRQYGLDFGPGIGPGPIGPTGLAIRTGDTFLAEQNVSGAPVFCADCDNDRIVVFNGTGLPRPSGGGSFGEGVLHRPRQLAIDSEGRLYVTGLHQHEPPASATDINDPFSWQIQEEHRWVSVFDSNSGGLLAKLEIPAGHDQLTHAPRSGLHWHGYGIAIDTLDESIVYVQGEDAIFVCQIDWASESKTN